MIGTHPISIEKHILVTGGTGFIGSNLVRVLLADGHRVRVTGLEPLQDLTDLGAEFFTVSDLSQEPDWTQALVGIDTVVHLAGLAHQMGPASPELDSQFDRVNHQATATLVQAMSRCPGLGRFLFISSVAVHGESPEMPLTAGSPLAPISAYGKSKFHAEQAIANGLKDSSLIWGIFRPVLVFGPHNPGNMARLEGLIRRRLPVPVGLQPNRRSFLFVGNLISAIQAFLNADAPPSGKAWVVADQDYCSTADLVHWMGQAMGMPSRVLPIPDKVLHVLGSVGDILGKIGVPSPWNSTVAHKLLGSFYADTSPLQEDLIWKAPWTTKEGIQETYQSHIADPSIPGQDHRPSNGAKE